MRMLLQDLRYGVRVLLKKPSFTSIAIVTIALGVGANSAIFSVVNAVLLRPLSYLNSEQLVMIWGKLPAHGLEKLSASGPEFVDYRERNHALSSIAAYTSSGRNLTGAGEPERVTTTFVTAGFFSVLETLPWRGRTFVAEEDQPGHDQSVILSYSIWQRRFAGDDSIVGQSITIDGKVHVVVGVMPPDFEFPDADTQIWKPIAFTAEDLSEDERGSHYLSLIARMKPGVQFEQAQADVASIAAGLQKEHPGHYEEGSGWSASVVGLHEETVGDVRLTLLVLLSAVGFVLLIACANVANLVLARTATRQREMAIRSALGAGRLRIIRQVLTESLSLSLSGGALGILVALWGKELLASLSPANLPRLKEVSIDSRVLLFTLAISVFTGLVFGIVPALQASNLNLSEALKESGSKSTASKSRLRLRGLFVVGEIALAMVLLVGAVLMIRSLNALQRVEMGFDPSNVLTMRLSLPRSVYSEPRRQRAFYDQVINRIEALPEVNSAGVVNFLPLSGTGNQRNISVEGQPENPINVEFRISNPGYFRAIGIELRLGRLYDEHDRENSTYVAVVNEAFLRIFLPDQDPLGKRIKMGGMNSPFQWLSIVGVVKDLKHRGLDVEAKPEMYVPYSQPPLPDWNIQSMFVAVRTKNEPKGLIGAARGIVQEIDKDQPIYGVSTMQQLLGKSLAPRRFNMLLMGMFSAIALALASIGIYGVMSYSVTERTREIGIRMALGARTGDVLRMVVKQGVTLTLLGVGIGLAASFALTRLIESLLFKVSAADPLTFALIPILLTGAALGASVVPAHRATKVDPMIALRYE